jgi:hypothetical protein
MHHKDLSPRVATPASSMRAVRARLSRDIGCTLWREFRKFVIMATLSQFATQSSVARITPQMLRDEARLLTIAGVMLLAIGFPVTLVLAAHALAPRGLSPVLPLAVGGPPIILGYVACHYASVRLSRARDLEGSR